MSGSTQANTNVASLNSYLPPVLESTFVMYLILPGLCAFFLFLLIFLVAFKLIKTSKHKSTDEPRCNIGSYVVEQSLDTSIYEVICESRRTSMIQNGTENSGEKSYSHNLQVCLPDSHDPQGSKINDVQAMSELEFPYILHASESQGHKSQYYYVSGLVNYLEEGSIPRIDTLIVSGIDDFDASAKSTLKSLDHEHPVYESLDKTWRKTSHSSEYITKMKIMPSDRVCSKSDHLESSEELRDEKALVTIQNTNDMKSAFDKVVCCFSEQPLCDSTTSALDSQIHEEDDVCDSSEENDDNLDGSFPAQIGQAICKLSIIVGTDECDNKLSKPAVKHYYYKINQNFNNPSGQCVDDYQTWENKFNSSHLLLTSHQPCDIGDKDNTCQNNLEQQKCAFKLQLVNTSCLPNDNGLNKLDISHNKEVLSNYKKSDSYETLSKRLPCNHRPRRKREIKKSQSFKETEKYSKADRKRKFSLGALSNNTHNKTYREVEHHHRSFDNKLEVERILARLGPLPPTPTSNLPPPIPSSSPPLLQRVTPSSLSHTLSLPEAQQLTTPLSEENTEDGSPSRDQISSLTSALHVKYSTEKCDPSAYDEKLKRDEFESFVETENTAQIDSQCNNARTVPNQTGDSLESANDSEHSRGERTDFVIENRGTNNINILREEKELSKSLKSHYFIIEKEKHSCLSDDDCNTGDEADLSDY